jgi:hypothetical protein
MEKGQKALVLLNSASTSPARPVPCQNPFSLTPGRAAGRPGSCEEDPEEQSARPGGAPSRRVRLVRPLDSGGPYGCRDPSATH